MASSSSSSSSSSSPPPNQSQSQSYTTCPILEIGLNPQYFSFVPLPTSILTNPSRLRREHGIDWLAIKPPPPNTKKRNLFSFSSSPPPIPLIPISKVTLTGLITSLKQTSTKLVFTLDDASTPPPHSQTQENSFSPLIDCTLWLNDFPEEYSSVDERKTDYKIGDRVTLTGKIRYLMVEDHFSASINSPPDRKDGRVYGIREVIVNSMGKVEDLFEETKFWLLSGRILNPPSTKQDSESIKDMRVRQGSGIDPVTAPTSSSSSSSSASLFSSSTSSASAPKTKTIPLTGEWNCPTCDHRNFRKHLVCTKYSCAVDRPGYINSKQVVFGVASVTVDVEAAKKVGGWSCGCGNFNHVCKKTCWCGVGKPRASVSVAETAAVLTNGIPSSTSTTSDTKAAFDEGYNDSSEESEEDYDMSLCKPLPPPANNDEDCSLSYVKAYIDQYSHNCFLMPIPIQPPITNTNSKAVPLQPYVSENYRALCAILNIDITHLNVNSSYDSDAIVSLSELVSSSVSISATSSKTTLYNSERVPCKQAINNIYCHCSSTPIEDQQQPLDPSKKNTHYTYTSVTDFYERYNSVGGIDPFFEFRDYVLTFIITTLKTTNSITFSYPQILKNQTLRLHAQDHVMKMNPDIGLWKKAVLEGKGDWLVSRCMKMLRGDGVICLVEDKGDLHSCMLMPTGEGRNDLGGFFEEMKDGDDVVTESD